MDRTADLRRHGVDHPDARPRLRQVEHLAADLEHRGADRITCRLGDQDLADVHDVVPVAEGLVQLDHRELGVVPGRDALVAEDPTDLEHALHAADDQPLEMQFERDAQVELHVERVVVRGERAGVRPAGFDVQHRGLDLDEAALVERSPEAGDDLVADLEGPLRLAVDDQVGVSLPEAGVDVGESVPLVGQRPDRLGQQLDLLGLDRQLALAGGHHGPVHTDPVAEIELLDRPRTPRRRRRPSR